MILFGEVRAELRCRSFLPFLRLTKLNPAFLTVEGHICLSNSLRALFFYYDSLLEVFYIYLPVCWLTLLYYSNILISFFCQLKQQKKWKMGVPLKLRLCHELMTKLFCIWKDDEYSKTFQHSGLMTGIRKKKDSLVLFLIFIVMFIYINQNFEISNRQFACMY